MDLGVDPLDDLAQLNQACASCQRCGLAQGRQQVVVGRGNPRAPLLLIGEAPGAEEDASGLPFVGRSGRLLDQLLAEAGFNSNRDAYIANVVKCRPPSNRKPTSSEMVACRGWLEQQITLINPAVILLAGATALEGVLGIRGGITRLRGQWLEGELAGAGGGPNAGIERGSGPQKSSDVHRVPALQKDSGLQKDMGTQKDLLLRGRWLMPIFHPSYLIRFSSEQPGSPRRLTQEDLRRSHHKLVALVGDPRLGGWLPSQAGPSRSPSDQ